MNEFVTWGITFSTLWYWVPTHICDNRYEPDAVVDYWGFGSIFIYRMVEIDDTDENSDFTA